MTNILFGKDATAQGVAKQRLIETLAAPNKRIINDLFAERFVLGASVIKLMGHKASLWLTDKFAPGFHEHLIARTRYVDDFVRQSVANGAEQYVILGAGYDSRAHRLELPPELKVFEVDQADVQTKKREKLSHGLSGSNTVTYVSADFNQQSLVEQLLAAGFDQSKPTVFTLEGVSQYISKQALSTTIEALAALTYRTRSTLFISYVDQRLKDDPKACFGEGYPQAIKRANTICRLSEKVGEPWVSFYNADEIEWLLSLRGFAIQENKTLEDLNAAYFTPIGRAIPEQNILKLEHFVIAAG
ncbi:class I SAM-dependent methyltransferase [Vibrio sp. 10N]|uniref:class I SAM-dependent methyltransferase n=1 Tax=Vibrio sp. 10N TaxID=3058938 RepID=UPI00281468EF|nr:class I SAM-dependent methyltransferase [Vibrio sp. 10N]